MDEQKKGTDERPGHCESEEKSSRKRCPHNGHLFRSACVACVKINGRNQDMLYMEWARERDIYGKSKDQDECDASFR